MAVIPFSKKGRVLLEDINKLCQKLYHAHGMRPLVRWPWVLVKVLPKEQMKGGIILPQSQNKVLYEGLVLETYKPFWRKFRKDSTGETLEVLVESDYKPGDHVIFPHFAGVPVGELMDEKEFRMVPEETPWDKEGRALIYGKLTYEQLNWAKKKAKEFKSKSAYERFMDEYYVIPKVVETKTISGA